MTPQDIFNQLADNGYSLRRAVEFTDRCRAAAVGRKQSSGLLSDIMSAAKGFTGMVHDAAATSAPVVKSLFIAPPVLGYVAGDLLARGMDADNSNVSDIQEQELVAELMANAEALRRRQRLRDRVVS